MSAVRARIADLRTFDALLVTSLIWFLAKFVRYTFPPLFETFRAEYGVSPATLGLLFTGLMVAYGGMQFPSGALADRLGRGRVITVGVLLVAATATLLFATQAFPVLVAAMLLIGVGTGVHKTVAIDLMAAVYPNRTGRTLGTMDAIGELSGVAAPAVVVAVIATALDWSVVFLLVGVAGVGLAVAFHALAGRRAEARTTQDGPEDQRAVAGSPGVASYLRAFRDPRFALFVAVVVAFSFVWNGVAAFLPLYLSAAKGLSTGRAGLLYGALFVAGVVQPLTGALADRFGRMWVMVATLGIQGVALAALLAATDEWALAGAVAAVGLGIHGFRPARDAHLIAAVPDAASGGTLGMVRTVMIGVGAASPAVVGYLSTVAGFAAAFGVLLAAVAGAAVATAALAVGGRI